jgi:hypothetical protein
MSLKLRNALDSTQSMNREEVFFLVDLVVVIICFAEYDYYLFISNKLEH